MRVPPAICSRPPSCRPGLWLDEAGLVMGTGYQAFSVGLAMAQRVVGLRLGEGVERHWTALWLKRFFGFFFNIKRFTVKNLPPTFSSIFSSLHVIPRGCSFPRTAIRDNHQLGGLKQQKFILSWL